MKLAVMQPYFLPYIGTFQLINYVDQYVFYDDVNYMRGFVNRNTIKSGEADAYVNIKLNKASQNRLINEIEVIESIRVPLEKVAATYKKYPHFSDLDKILDELGAVDEPNIGRLNGEVIKVLAPHLGVSADFKYASELDYDRSLKGEAKIMDICKNLGASEYTNPIGGAGLYNRDHFREIGCTLSFFAPSVINKQYYTVLHDIAAHGLETVRSHVAGGVIS